MNMSVAVSGDLNERLLRHLVRSDGHEDLCFALWNPSRGRARTTALLRDVILPEPGDRNVHGNASFNSQYVQRVIDAALATGCGIAFIHSHPASGWQDMSADDVRAEQLLAPTALGATGLPLVGLTLGARDGTWSARFWEKVAPREYVRRWCGSVRVVGHLLRVSYCDRVMKPPQHRPTQIRTVSAWGPKVQADLARLRIGIVGLGSVGSIVAEALARMGFQRIVLIDFDTLKEHNLDRTLHATSDDVLAKRAKVVVSRRALVASATAAGFHADPVEFSVCEEEGFRAALDCDVLFSCVDRPWARSTLNFIAYAHLIPVVDGGIRASRTRHGDLRGADWKAHTAGPTRRCLQCLQQYDPGLVAADKRGDLDDPKYLESLPEDHVARANENVFGFSLGLASLEVAQLLMLAIGPAGVGPLPQNYHLVTGEIDIGDAECEHDCGFPARVAVGDREHPGTDTHPAAELERQARGTLPKPGWLEALRRLWPF
jgi:molybdopterin-synthase adenylyltransferase